ncbi:MAG TPA: hypothetical protein VGQ94_07635, partial [Terriglobales bacterium]|nr:hypothetical protein [Terriglobales bacterium]
MALSATLSESLTVSLSGATQFWDIAHGNPLTGGNASNPGDAAITVTTTWVLTPGRASVAVYAYFASATAALVGPLGPTNVASSILEITVGGVGPTPVSGNNLGFGVAGSSSLLDTIAITGANKNSSKADVLTFN